MRTLFLAIGNPLRGDDGVAHRLAELLPPRSGLVVRCVHQLTIELAEEIARYEAIIFADADPQAREPRLEAVPKGSVGTPLTHHMSPAALIALSGSLYGFRGEAYQCRLPAREFTTPDLLTPEAEDAAVTAARLLSADRLWEDGFQLFP